MAAENSFLSSNKVAGVMDSFTWAERNPLEASGLQCDFSYVVAGWENSEIKQNAT